MASGNMKVIKRRIKSIESTMQITKAMELVASSKFRKAKEKADSAAKFFDAVYETMSDIASQDKYFNSIYTRRATQSSTALLIVIAGDRGLAGGYNANAIKLAETRMSELGENTVLMPIGKKAVEHFTKRGAKIFKGFENIAENMNIEEAYSLSQAVIDVYNKHSSIGRVELIFTDYVSPLLQQARRISVIPIENLTDDISVSDTYHCITRYEPSAEEVFEKLIPKYVAGLLYGAVICSFASEQASRRMAMENATDNASEMIDNLSLIYNRARQSAITQEITEIVGGANAQN